MKKITKININLLIFAIVFVLGLPSISYATISLPWTSSFNCGPGNIQNVDPCEGMTFSGGMSTINGKYTQISSSANNPLGSANGFRVYMAPAPGESHDAQTDGAYRITFSSAQKEFWIRWYNRYSDNVAWSPLEYKKTLYIRTGAPATAQHDGSVVAEPTGHAWIVGTQGGGDVYQISSSYGWYDIYPTGTADGTWHCYEIHMKMDTSNTWNGVGEFWIDGILRASNYAVNFTGGDATARQGWTWLSFNDNQHTLDPSMGEGYVDFDDFSIASSTSPPSDGWKKDAGNRNFIGPINWGGSTDNIPPAAPSGLSVQ